MVGDRPVGAFEYAKLGEFAEAFAALATFSRYRSDPEFTVAPAVAPAMARSARELAAVDPAKHQDTVTLVEQPRARIEGREAGGFADRSAAR